MKKNMSIIYEKDKQTKLAIISNVKYVNNILTFDLNGTTYNLKAGISIFRLYDTSRVLDLRGYTFA